jgi:hypothetical protein
MGDEAEPSSEAWKELMRKLEAAEAVAAAADAAREVAERAAEDATNRVLKAEAAVEQVPRAHARTSGTAVLTAVLLVRKCQVETLKKQLDSTRAESLQAKARHAVEIKQLAAATAAAWRKQAAPTK